MEWISLGLMRELLFWSFRSPRQLHSKRVYQPRCDYFTW